MTSEIGSEIGIALLGTKFMGRTHSNAWSQVTRFFDVPITPVLRTVAGRDPRATAEFAARWGWQGHTTDVASVFADPAVGLVDIGTPNDAHRDAAIAALEAGRHVACEKPLARTLGEAREMAAAARSATGRTFVWFSYRRVPAIALARLLVQQGRIGRLRHVRAVYSQQWGQGADAAWRFDATVAGSGALGDIAAHIVDTVQFVTGEAVTSIGGAYLDTFDDRHTVDDATLFLARLSGGAAASFEASRYATGWHNHHGFEVHGEKGALRFWFDDFSQLQYCDLTADPLVRGWTTIDVADGAAGHPWLSAWWPPGHPIGYEHTFTNMAADLLGALAGREPVVPIPDFDDALQVQAVLETVTVAAARGARVEVAEVTDAEGDLR